MEPQASTSPERSTLDEFLGRQPSSKRMRQLRKAAPVVGLLLLAGLAALYFTGRGSDQPNYATTPVQRGDLRVTVSATGNLQPTNEVEVGSELSGLVTEVNVDNNDRVTRGQVLARIDTARLQDSIAQSRASLQSAIASVAQAEATAQQTQASLARFDEVHALSGGKVPSAAELDTARAEYARAVAGVRTAEAGVAQARAQLSSDQTQFSKALILSPVTGVVLSRQIDPGQTVAASFNAPVLFLIAEDLSAMRLEVKVDEADVGQVAAGQSATFQVDAFPGRTFPAQVQRVDVGANAGTGSTTSSNASNTVVSYTAVLTVDNKDSTLRPGMTATAEIVTSEKQRRAAGAQRRIALLARRQRGQWRAQRRHQGTDAGSAARNRGQQDSRGQDRTWQRAESLRSQRARRAGGRGSHDGRYERHADGSHRRLVARRGGSDHGQARAGGHQWVMTPVPHAPTGAIP